MICYNLWATMIEKYISYWRKKNIVGGSPTSSIKLKHLKIELGGLPTTIIFFYRILRLYDVFEALKLSYLFFFKKSYVLC